MWANVFYKIYKAKIYILSSVNIQNLFHIKPAP